MSNTPLFDAQESEARKQRGIDRASSVSDDLALARRVARELALRNGTTTADAVGEVLQERYGIATLGPAAGALFRGGDWVFTGERIKSTRVTNNSRELRVWKLK